MDTGFQQPGTFASRQNMMNGNIPPFQRRMSREASSRMGDMYESEDSFYSNPTGQPPQYQQQPPMRGGAEFPSSAKSAAGYSNDQFDAATEWSESSAEEMAPQQPMMGPRQMMMDQQRQQMPQRQFQDQTMMDQQQMMMDQQRQQMSQRQFQDPNLQGRARSRSRSVGRRQASPRQQRMAAAPTLDPDSESRSGESETSFDDYQDERKPPAAERGLGRKPSRSPRRMNGT